MPITPISLPIKTISDLKLVFQTIQGDMIADLPSLIFGTAKELQEHSRQGLEYPVLVVDVETALQGDDNGGDFLLLFNPNLLVLKTAKPNNSTEKMQAMNDSQLILEEIIARLDHYSRKLPPYPFVLERKSIRFVPAKAYTVNNEFGYMVSPLIRRKKNIWIAS